MEHEIEEQYPDVPGCSSMEQEIGGTSKEEDGVTKRSRVEKGEHMRPTMIMEQQHVFNTHQEDIVHEYSHVDDDIDDDISHSSSFASNHSGKIVYAYSKRLK